MNCKVKKLISFGYENALILLPKFPNTFELIKDLRERNSVESFSRLFVDQFWSLKYGYRNLSPLFPNLLSQINGCLLS